MTSKKEVNDAEWTDDRDYALEVSMANKRKEDSAPTAPSKIPIVKKSKAVKSKDGCSPTR